jgi:hypothetical protein
MKRLLYSTSLSLGALLLAITIAHAADPTPFYGDVVAPSYIAAWGEGPNALVSFINVLMRFVFFAGGLFVLWKFIDAGFTFVNSAGDPQKVSEARNKILFAFIGILIMVSAFVAAAVIGLIFFGDAMAILQPTLLGAP